ncbi:hypothetical protein [Saccharothrix sp.]|uniref:hypothetical protein n=1 Tax=Saccharothrix sp. TaxID=1873460 RepID=UPI0028116374|nr:hypothetical protein [Saccharothrix sp.]
MREDDLVRQLITSARFVALPLLAEGGVFAGLHLHRHLPGALDVVQVRDGSLGSEAAHARLRNSFDLTVPFAPPAALYRVSGRLMDIAGALLLPPGQTFSDAPAWPPSGEEPT